MSLSPLSKPASSDLASADLANLAELARDGSLDLTTVAFRVRTDLMVGLSAPTQGEVSSFMEFAAAALPKLQERDLAIVSQKLAAWPHTPAELKAALILRLPAAAAMFEQGKRDRAAKLADSVVAPAVVAPSVVAPSVGTTPAAPEPPPSQPAISEMDALRAELLPKPTSVKPSEKPAGQRAEAAATIEANSAAAPVPDEIIPMGEPTDMPLPLDARIEAARVSLAAGDGQPARAILADASLGPQAQAAFFLVATPVQQSLMLSGLAHLERSQPRRMAGTRERMALERILDLAGQDRTGAFLALSDAVGGTPEFAARITLDASRKLAGLCLVAIGGNDEDAVRFALRLADEPACDVATIFALADMARATQPQVAARMVRAIGGAQVQMQSQMAERTGQHVPAADPSGAPQRQGGVGQTGVGQGGVGQGGVGQGGVGQGGVGQGGVGQGMPDRRGLSPQEAARRLLAG